MADTGWKFPNVAVGNYDTGGTGAWSDPNNIKADDGSSASITRNTSVGSLGLAAKDFDFSAVPDGATIDKIEIRIGDYLADDLTDTPRFIGIELVMPDGISESVGASDTTNFPITLSLQTNDGTGIVNDTFEEVFTKTDVNDVDFGFVILADLAGTTSTLFEVDFMQMRVFFHEGLPTTINPTGGVPGHSPPFKSSAGNFYAVAAINGTDSHVNVYKTSDPASDSWAAQDTADRPNMDGFVTNGYTVVSAVQDADVIHIATHREGTASSTFGYHYHTFNMATDQWAIDELIEALGPVVGFAPWISIAVRGDGDVIVAYAGLTDGNMGDQKERVDVDIRNGSWSGPTSLDAAGDIHYGTPNCVLGTSDGVHITWQRSINTTNDPPISWLDTQGRTLDSGDSLSAVDTTTGLSAADMLGANVVLTYDDGGTQRVISTAINQNNTVRTSLGIETSGDIDLSAGVSTENFTTTAGTFTNGEVGIHTWTELDGVLYCLFSGGGTIGVDQDLWYSTSSNDGQDWDTPTEEIDAITVNFISANIYVRGLDTVIAYVYDDDGIQKYNEKVLSSITQPFHHVIKENRRDMRGIITL